MGASRLRVKFNENPFRGSRVFQADGQTHKTKLTLTILNLVDTLKTKKKNSKIYSFIKLFFLSFAA